VQIQPSAILGPDDLLELSVSYCPELSHSFRIDSDGDILLPLLSAPINVTGHTPAEVSSLVAKAIAAQNILVDPAVNVSVLEYRSRPVSVFGAVVAPLTFQATGGTTLLDALTKAGGLKATAGSNIYITRGAGGPMSSIQTVPVSAMTGGTSPLPEIHLSGGEEIRIPEASSIFVVGNVRRPGMHPIQSESDMTVIKAISISEGLDAFSAKRAFIYRVSGPAQPRNEIAVELGSIMARKAPDMMMRADDILYVPTSTGKRMASNIFKQATGFGQMAGAGILINR
jgi:polysaccharide export outer membrane protein